MIFLDYFYWHYIVAPFEILRIMTNYFKSIWHQFLITQHLKTLFSQWRRQNPADVGKKSVSLTDKILDSIMDVVIDFFLRIVAAIIRLSIITTGLLTEVLIAVGFFLILLIWLAWPLISIYFVYLGLGSIL